MFAVDPNFRPSYAQQFNLTLEHEIAPWSLLIRAAAVGNLGRHLYNTYNANQPMPGAGGDQYPASVLQCCSGSSRCQLFRLRRTELLLRRPIDRSTNVSAKA